MLPRMRCIKKIVRLLLLKTETTYKLKTYHAQMDYRTTAQCKSCYGHTINQTKLFRPK